MTPFIALILMANSERATPLKHDVGLDILAQVRAQMLCNSGTFSHDGFKNYLPWGKTLAGENLAKGFVDAASTNDAFMASPTHRQNIQNPVYKYMGVGEADNCKDGRNRIVEFFTT